MKFLKSTNLISALLLLTTFSIVSIAETEKKAETEIRILEDLTRQCNEMIVDNKKDAAYFCAELKIILPTIKPGLNDL